MLHPCQEERVLEHSAAQGHSVDPQLPGEVDAHGRDPVGEALMEYRGEIPGLPAAAALLDEVGDQPAGVEHEPVVSAAPCHR